MKLFTSSFLLRLFFFALIIGTLPAILVGICAYSISYQTVIHNAQNTSVQLLQQAKSDVELNVAMDERSLVNFLETPLFSSVMALDREPGSFQAFRDLQNQKNSVQVYDQGILDMQIINFQHQWLLTKDGLSQLPDSPNYAQYEEEGKRPESTYWLLGSGQTGDADVLKRIKKYPLNSPSPIGLVEMDISRSQLFANLSKPSNSSKMVVLDGDWNQLNSGPGLGSDLTEQLKQGVKNAPDGEFTKSFYTQNKKFYVVASRPAFKDWLYVNAISIDTITRQAQNIGKVTFAVCFFMVLLIAAAAYAVSRRMYSPINTVYQLFLNERENVRTGKDELAFIEDRVRSIIGNQDVLRAQIHSQMYQLKEFYVLKMLKGELQPKEIMERAEIFEIADGKRSMFVFAVQIFSFDGTPYTQTDKDLMLFAINNIMLHLFADEYLLRPVVLDDLQVTVLGTEEAGDEAAIRYIYTHAEHMIATIEQYLRLKVSVGISRPFDSYKETQAAYKEAVLALKYQVRLNDNGVFYLNEVQPKTETRFVFPKFLKDELLQSVHTGDASRVKDILHELITTLFDAEFTHHQYHQYLIRLLSDILGTLDDYGLSFNGGSPEVHSSLFEQLLEKKIPNEIEKWFMDSVVLPVIDQIMTRNDSELKTLSKRIMDIIENEYNQELSFEEVASRLQYHPSYIRRVFQKETGLSLQEYTIQYRIRLAQRWLLDSDRKIQEISANLGYTNTQNFIRVFRKVTGMTPGQYRESGKETR